MRMRRLAAVVAMAAAVTLPVASTGVAAYAAKPSAAPSSHKKAPVKPAPVKKVKVAFTASGKVTKADATSVTVAVKGGTRDVKGRTVTIGVPSTARVLLNGKKVAVSALAAGYQITVSGTYVDAVYTATKVEASGKVVKPTPAPSASTSPAPTPAPSASTPGAEPSDEPSAAPTEAAPAEGESPAPDDSPSETSQPAEETPAA
ncbi:hypothetical protein ACTOB_005923 [Actinoplanes oblitus]|uniref:DUF5666 domain-containing protein n=1 Tax=Actinoplanes oblitus TaxID=3040509 RepID=A0ABY8WC01_9ACTN|nr:hypothetical protein [Actinoplanes oblitus]WIM93929.1 hypothetical protein ACTOB_005923 [Actinoplanes oblitus]